MKRCLVSALAAGVLTAGLIYAAQQPSNGPNVFSLCVFPFYMVGVLFSGNIHQPSPAGSVVSMFLFFFAVAYAAQMLWTKIAKKS